MFRRGSTVEVLGSTSLLFAVIAAASGGKAWSAAVGMNDLGFVAVADFGIALERFAVVPEPGPQWLSVVAALVDGVEIVAVRPPSPVAVADRQRLAARVRQRGTLLLATEPWDGADVTLRVSGHRCYGQGRGRLKSRTADVQFTDEARWPESESSPCGCRDRTASRSRDASLSPRSKQRTSRLGA